MVITTAPTEKKILTADPEWELLPHQVHHLRQSAEPHLLLDVRHEVEWELGKIAGAMLIPLDELGQRLEELVHWRRERVVVYCRSGVRSLRATELLRENGFETVHSMAGGILAWGELIDPSVAWW